MLWSTKSQCSAYKIARIPCRIGTLSLLVKKTRSRTVVNDRALIRSCRIMRIQSSLSHSSRVLIISRQEDGDKRLSNLNNRRITSWRYQSRREQFVISICSLIASEIYRRNNSALYVNCTAILIKNLPACPTSPPPLKKKKLALRRFYLKYLRATVCAIVDFPVLIKLLSQKIYRSSSLST